jgi:hypothetical protein
MNAMFQAGRCHPKVLGYDSEVTDTSSDRLGRLAGKEAMMIPVVSQDPMKTSALPTVDSLEFFTAWSKKSNWKNEVSVKTCVSAFVSARSV